MCKSSLPELTAGRHQDIKCLLITQFCRSTGSQVKGTYFKINPPFRLFPAWNDWKEWKCMCRKVYSCFPGGIQKLWAHDGTRAWDHDDWLIWSRLSLNILTEFFEIPEQFPRRGSNCVPSISCWYTSRWLTSLDIFWLKSKCQRISINIVQQWSSARPNEWPQITNKTGVAGIVSTLSSVLN